MKKYEYLLTISFIPYAFILFAQKYVSAQIWADCVFFMYILAVSYQLSYIFSIRKKVGIGPGRAVAKVFLGITIAMNSFIVMYYVKAYFFGYSWTWFFQTRGPFYGLEAFKQMWLVSMFLRPIFIVNVIYQLGYWLVIKKISQQSKSYQIQDQGNDK